MKSLLLTALTAAYLRYAIQPPSAPDRERNAAGPLTPVSV